MAEDRKGLKIKEDGLGEVQIAEEVITIIAGLAATEVEGVDSMSQEEYRDAAINAVQTLSNDVGINPKNEKITEEDLDQLAIDALNDACYPGNPREATKEQVIELFRKLM